MATMIKNSVTLSTKDVQNAKTSAKDKKLADLRTYFEKQQDDESFETIATNLFTYMTQTNKNSRDGRDERNERDILEAIDLFLVSSEPLTGKNGNQSGKENYMDHCLRLIILVKAMKKKLKLRTNLVTEIGKLISRRWPVLAFMRPKDVTNLSRHYCTHKKMHDFTEVTEIPFCLAMQNEDKDLIHIMLESLRSAFSHKSDELKYLGNDSLLQVLRSLDNFNSVLSLALGPSQNNVSMLQELLTVQGIALTDSNTPDSVFNRVIGKGMDSVIVDFLENGVLVSKEHLKEAIRLLPDTKSPSSSTMEKPPNDNPPVAKDCSRTNVLKALMSKASREVLDYEIVKSIIKYDRTSVWTVEFKQSLESKIQTYLLPTAVLHRSLNFIKLFVNENPDALRKAVTLPDKDGAPVADGVSDGSDRYPLWYNNHRLVCNDKDVYKFSPLGKDESDQRREDIRDILVDKMIRELPINLFSDVLHQSSGTSPVFQPFTVKDI